MLPLIAGVIVGLVLGPVADRMVRLGVPQGLSAAVLVVAGFLAFSFIITVFAAPFAIWSDRLPEILAVLKLKLSSIIDAVRRIEGMAVDLAPAASPKISVSDTNHVLDMAVGSTAAAGGLLIFMATVYFYLATRRDLKARLLRMCLGHNARQHAGIFFEQIEAKVASYFAVVTVVNIAIGVITGLIAWLSGLPLPVFWGVAAFVLNYVAFVGPLIMTALLFGAGLLDSATPWAALWPALVYYVIHLIEGNVVTPVAIGRRLTMSPFLLFIAFVFWLWLWGPFGAILSTPILLLGSVAFETIGSYREVEVLTQETTIAPAAMDT